MMSKGRLREITERCDKANYTSMTEARLDVAALLVHIESLKATIRRLKRGTKDET